jgi:hypothetical protein
VYENEQGNRNKIRWTLQDIKKLAGVIFGWVLILAREYL